MTPGHNIHRNYQGRPHVWCELLNFGGNHGMYGGARLLENMTGGTALVESMHGAGSPQAQRIMIARQGNIQGKKQMAKEIAGIK